MHCLRQSPRYCTALRESAAAAMALYMVACVAHAATPDPASTRSPIRALAVGEIVQRNAAARGGIEAWHALATLSEKGRIEHGQMKAPKSRHGNAGAGPEEAVRSIPFTLQIKRPHKMRVEMSLGDATAVQTFDGAHGWTLEPSTKGVLVREFSEAEAAAAADQVDPEGPLLNAGAKGTSVRLDGVDEVEGHQAYRLLLTLRKGGVRHVWIDAQTFLDLKVDGTRLIDGRAWPTETYFYDWHTVAGVRIPYRIESAVGDVRTSTRLLVDHALVNEPIADMLFRLPAEAQANAKSAAPKDGGIVQNGTKP